MDGGRKKKAMMSHLLAPGSVSRRAASVIALVGGTEGTRGRKVWVSEALSGLPPAPGKTRAEQRPLAKY